MMYTITRGLKGQEKQVGQGESLADAINGLLQSVAKCGTVEDTRELSNSHLEAVMVGVVAHLSIPR